MEGEQRLAWHFPEETEAWSWPVFLCVLPGVVAVVVAAAAAVVVACVVLIGGKNEAYRSIMVYQINGNATITRERVGEMAAYENLMLQSADK